jgi:hypothetical protein
MYTKHLSYLHVTTLLALTTVCIWPATSAAGDAYEFGAFSSYRFSGHLSDDTTGDTLKFGTAAGYGAVVDIPYNADGQLEFIWSHSREPLGPKSFFVGAPRFDVDVDYFHIGGIHNLSGGRVRPFVAGGFGVTRLDPQQSGLSAATEFSVGLGGGAKVWLTRHLGLRLEGRGYINLTDTHGSLFCGNNGCVARINGSGFGQFELTAGVFAAF